VSAFVGVALSPTASGLFLCKCGRVVCKERRTIRRGLSPAWKWRQAAWTEHSGPD
jgi:hypothetical protein